MNKVLVIDGSVTNSMLISGEIKKEIKVEVVSANSLKETTKLLETSGSISAAIIDPLLGDDSSGKVVDLVIEHNIPVIIFSSAVDRDLLDSVINKNIVDYVMKSTRNNVPVVINLLSQILRNQQTAILVIDDSKTVLMQISEALANLNLKILEAYDVEEALKKIKEYPEVKLLLTDYNMEGKNGIDLTREVRKKYSNKEVSIIGHSSYGGAKLSADFLKNGANDFINKPFDKEELVNRVLIQLDMISYIESIRDASEKDFLTGIYNRKYVYEVGRKLFDNAKRGNISLACAMIDIDHFKNVNDTYGHDVGDKVIVRLASELESNFRTSDIVGRLGGEEFCVVLTNPDLSVVEELFENLRKKIEAIVIFGKDENNNSFKLNFTVSIGLTTTISDSFEEMIKFADLKLYEAKNYGRNLVVM